MTVAAAWQSRWVATKWSRSAGSTEPALGHLARRVHERAVGHGLEELADLVRVRTVVAVVRDQLQRRDDSGLLGELASGRGSIGLTDGDGTAETEIPLAGRAGLGLRPAVREDLAARRAHDDEGRTVPQPSGPDVSSVHDLDHDVVGVDHLDRLDQLDGYRWLDHVVRHGP